MNFSHFNFIKFISKKRKSSSYILLLNHGVMRLIKIDKYEAYNIYQTAQFQRTPSFHK